MFWLIKFVILKPA